jgi:hypothetical protein
MSETLEKVSDTILESPLTITVDVNPRNGLHRRLQQWGITPLKRVFILKPIKLGVLIRISRILLSINMTLPDTQKILEVNYEAIDRHGEKLARIIALAIHNSREDANPRLVKFILDNFTLKEIKSVLSLVLQQMDLTSFMSSIISIKGMNVLGMQDRASVNGADKPEVSL